MKTDTRGINYESKLIHKRLFNYVLIIDDGMQIYLRENTAYNGKQ